VQAQLPIASHDAQQWVPAQGGEEVGGTVEPIAQDERVADEVGQAAFARVISLAAASALKCRWRHSPRPRS